MSGLENATACLEGRLNIFPACRYNSRLKPEADAALGRGAHSAPLSAIIAPRFKRCNMCDVGVMSSILVAAVVVCVLSRTASLESFQIIYKEWRRGEF